MDKKSKTPPQHKQRSKGPGGEQPAAKRSKSASVESSAVESAPAPRRSGRERKSAQLATDLVAPAAQRCGRDDCAVCGSNREHMRNKPCPAFAEPPRDDDVDPRKLDKKGPHFKASDDIIAFMDALDDDPTKLEPSDLYALACFKDGLKKSGRLDARWAFLAKIKARGDYDVDDINSDDGAQKAIEAVVREVHFKGGSKPSVEEMSKMGPLEMRTVVRVLSYIASWEHRTKAQMKGRQPLGAPLSDQARGAFVALVEGRKYDGVHVCTSLARSENEPWSKYWQGCLHLLNGGNRSLTGARKRFHELLASLRHGRAIWVCRPEMRAWLKERQCQYQRMMVSTTCHW